MPAERRTFSDRRRRLTATQTQIRLIMPAERRTFSDMEIGAVAPPPPST